MFNKYGEPISAYDLSKVGFKRSLQSLEQEEKYNPRPYDLVFQAQLREARKNSNNAND